MSDRYVRYEYKNRVIRVYDNGRVEIWNKYNSKMLAVAISVESAYKIIDAMYGGYG